MNPENVPLLDRDLLLRRLGGDASIVSEVYRDIAESFPRRLEECRRALEAGDMESLRRAVHTIKGSAATAAAERTALIASTLEALLRRGDTGRAALSDALDALSRCVGETLHDAGVE